MTNTEADIREVRIKFRESEDDIIHVLSGHVQKFGIIDYGKFSPGGVGGYAGIEVLHVQMGAHSPYVVHTVFVKDDLPDVAFEFEFFWGHYFTSLRAALDYLERDSA